MRYPWWGMVWTPVGQSSGLEGTLVSGPFPPLSNVCESICVLVCFRGNVLGRTGLVQVRGGRKEG